MNIERKKFIRKQALKALANCAPYGMTDALLFDSIETNIRPAVLRDELQEVLGAMEDFALIKRYRDSDNEAASKITSEGKAEAR